MDSSPAPDPRCSRPDLAADLPRWDRLGGGRRADLEIHAGNCPRCGPRLELLKLAEAWLLERGVSACPPAELLYDFGHGPGHLPLPPAEHEQVSQHVEGCKACLQLVESLELTPPVPLELDAGPRPVAPHALATRGQRTADTWFRLLPWAAAAALLLFVALWRTPTDASGAGAAAQWAALDDLPRASPLRGARENSLLAPRGKLLARPDEERGGVPARPLTFEIDPPTLEEGVAAPTGYHVRVFESLDDPFEAGELIAEFRSKGPLIEAPGLNLAPGNYTWEAWLVRGTVETRLDARDFDLVVDTASLAEFERLVYLDEPARSVSRLLALHEAGFESDARAIARGLPEGPQRNRYLEEFPER